MSVDNFPYEASEHEVTSFLQDKIPNAEYVCVQVETEKDTVKGIAFVKLKSDADVTSVLDQVSNLRMTDKTLQINKAKCKTCEVADGSICRMNPWTGEEEKVILERCARCKVVWYCGKKCQQQNWRYHKPICKKLNLKEYWLRKQEK